jgi:hypothetical protein
MTDPAQPTTTSATTAQATSTRSNPASSAQPAQGSKRSAEVRLARLHLRGGMLALARAELEQLAGTAGLDVDALADLAEARWRSGDLEGAAEAANAHLANGGKEPIAELVLAESLDRNGHLIDARAHSSRVIDGLGNGLDRLFAGEPRSTAWPAIEGDRMYTDTNEPGRRGLLVSGADMQAGAERHWEPAPLPGQAAAARSAQRAAQAAQPGGQPVAAPGPGGPSATPVSVPVASSGGQSIGELMDAGRAAGVELESVETEITAGHLDGIADRLALLFRMDRALAPVILSLAERVLSAMPPNDPRAASLNTLRGDIYRALGREAEANAAYQEAFRAVAPRPTTPGSTT